MKQILLWVAVCACLKTYAQEKNTSRPDSHAPIGVMGDHTHKKGEFMISYRFMSMPMEDNLVGSDDISADEVATTIPNRFSGLEGQPPTLRVIPLRMTMQMHMIGAMYAPSDKLTLMAMGTIISNEMDHTTYQGGMGTNTLGEFTTQSSGIGDTRLTALYKISGKAHINLGVSIPTGSVEEEDDVLTPMNMRPTLRLPYPMQLGSGTWDLLPGITFAIRSEKLGWGSQVSGVVRLGDNDNDFSYGNQLKATTWGSYLLTNWLSTSLRLDFSSLAEIDGQDPNIVAPVQTANPDFQGGTRLDALLGVNLVGQSGFTKNMRLAAEFGIPVIQDLNGPQLQTLSVLTLGYQYAF